MWAFHMILNVAMYMATNVGTNTATHVAVIRLRMSQFHDYECRSHMTTNIAVMTTNVRPKFPNVLLFPEHGDSEFLYTPNFSNVLFFPSCWRPGMLESGTLHRFLCFWNSSVDSAGRGETVSGAAVRIFPNHAQES